LDHFLK